MKPATATKFDKRNTATSKTFNNDIMSTNCYVTVIFPIYAQFGAIWKPGSEHMVCKTYIFINNNFLFYKNWKQN